MSENIIQKIADSIQQTAKVIDYDVRPTSRFHSFLQKIKIAKKKKKITMHPITLGTLIQISKLLVSVDVTIDDLKDIISAYYGSIASHGDSIVRIIALAFHGKPGEPPKRLVNSIKNNFTSRDLIGTLAIIVGQMDVQSFMLTIVSVKGMNAIKGMDKPTTSLQNPGEIIAPGQQSAV